MLFRNFLLLNYLSRIVSATSAYKYLFTMTLTPWHTQFVVFSICWGYNSIRAYQDFGNITAFDCLDYFSAELIIVGLAFAVFNALSADAIKAQ